MKSIGIVTDSHSGIDQKKAEELGIYVLPMPFYVNDECFYEGTTLTRDEFFAQLEAGAKVQTSQPAPGAVMELWDKVLQKHDQIIYMPISSGLSGSCATAAALAAEEAYEKKVFVVDNGRVATPLHRSVLDALELAEEGYSAEEIKAILEAARGNMIIYISVENLEFLKRGGRISGTTAMLGTALHIKPVLRFDTGMLESFQKCRGMKRARRTMIEALKQDLDTKFYDWSKNGEVSILAASSASEEETQDWLAEIKEAFPGMPVLYDDLTLGLSCHIGPGGLGIGCSCRPRRC